MYYHSALLLAGSSVERLPDIQGYIFTPEDLNKFTNSYKPPTLAQIFQSWGRFCSNAYYPPNTTPAGEAASWAMLGTNQFNCTVNSGALTGFVSPETFDRYTHQADLSSTNSDDDYIGLVIAFACIGGINHVLLAGRHSTDVPYCGGAGINFAIITNIKDSWNVIKAGSGGKCSVNAVSGPYGWNSLSPSRVKVIRDGSKITAQASPWRSTDLSAGEEISINLDDYPDLAWAKEKLPYGYACFSQAASTYANVEFSGAGELDANFLYDLSNGDVLTYSNGQWKPNGMKIWDHLGHPRKIINPTNGKEYMIGYNSITEIV